MPTHKPRPRKQTMGMNHRDPAPPAQTDRVEKMTKTLVVRGQAWQAEARMAQELAAEAIGPVDPSSYAVDAQALLHPPLEPPAPAPPTPRAFELPDGPVSLPDAPTDLAELVASFPLEDLAGAAADPKKPPRSHIPGFGRRDPQDSPRDPQDSPRGRPDSPRGRGRPRKGPRALELPPVSAFDTMARTLLQASTDLRYFIEAFLWIEDKNSGELMRFVLNPEQRVIVDAVQSDLNSGHPIRMIILKPRQIGVSTLIEAVKFWAMVFTPNYSVRVVLDKRDKAEVLIRTTKRFRDLFPPLACLRTGYDAKKTISVDNSTVLQAVDLARLDKWHEAANVLMAAYEDPDSAREEAEASKSLHSMMIIEAADKMAGRSATIRGLHASEVAYWPGDPADAFNGLKNSVPHAARTFVVIESTAHGRGGYFYQAWRRAEGRETGYRPIFFPWFDHPNYTVIPDVHFKRHVQGWTTPLDDITDDEKMICRKHGVRGSIMQEVMVWLNESWVVHPNMSGKGVSAGNLLWRRRTIRDNCEGQLERFLMEYPSTAEEAFIAAGADFFPKAVQDNLDRWLAAMPVIAKGDFVFDGAQLSAFMARRPGMALPEATFQSKSLEVVPGVPANTEAMVIGTQRINEPLITIWEWPIKTKLYVLGGDVAQGLSPTKNVREPDWSVCYVMEAVSGKVVAKLRGHIAPDLMAEKVALLARLYNGAFVGIESNPAGGGIVVNKILTQDLDTWNVMYSKDMASSSGNYSDRPGWYTHAGNRTPMFNQLLVSLSAGHVQIADPGFAREAAAIIREPSTGKPIAAPGEFDDCVIALAITNMLRLEPMGMTPEMLMQIRKDEEEAINASALQADPNEWVLRRQRALEQTERYRQNEAGTLFHPRLGEIY